MIPRINTIGRKIDKKIRRVFRSQKIWFKNLPHPKRSIQYIFHHIPKCAGTSAVDALSNWFIIIKDYSKGWRGIDNPRKYKNFCDNPIKIDKLRNYHLLVGHYPLEGSFLYQRYPKIIEDTRFKIFTFIRDPLELQISLYYYEIRNKRIPPNEFLEKRLLLRKNYIAARMPCDEFNYQEKLDRYFFIGLVERYQESFNSLAELIKKPYIKLKVYNNAFKSPMKLSENFISEFKEVNKLDYQIYNYVKKKYHTNKLNLKINFVAK